MPRTNVRIRRLTAWVWTAVAWGAVLWTAAAPLCAEAAQADAGQTERPNLIFFLTDDQRYDALGCAGNAIIQTPTMDRLAQQGVYFRQAFVTTSICAASRASLLTGRWERTHRFTFGTPPLRPELVETSYPFLMRQAGYRTGFIGKFGVQVPEGAAAKMFDVFHPLSRSPYFKRQPDGSEVHITDLAGQLAMEFLEACRPDEPFCLSISFDAPHAEDNDKENHYPWNPPADGLYDGIIIPPPRLATDEVFARQPPFLQDSMNRDRWYWRWDNPEKYQKNIRAYYRMISGVDYVMGLVLDRLEQLGLRDNTVVVFAGDNGYYAGSRGFAGKWSHYDESLRIPLIITDLRRPAGTGGLASDATVLNVDIPATLLDLAGIAPPETYQGRSLAPLLNGDLPSEWRTDFFCEHLMDHPRIPKWEGVRSRRWMYACYFEQEPPYECLYDLERDPDQLDNLAEDPQYAEQLTAMRSRCETLRTSYENAP